MFLTKWGFTLDSFGNLDDHHRHLEHTDTNELVLAVKA